MMLHGRARAGRLKGERCAQRSTTVGRTCGSPPVPEPEAGPGEVKLRVRYNGICGSDLLEYYDGPVTTRSTPHPLTGVHNPVIMGHELCGEVVALGEGVGDLEIGDLVAVEPVETCGHCLYCGLGQYNHCPSLAIQGYNRAGGLAEYTVVKRLQRPSAAAGRHARCRAR